MISFLDTTLPGRLPSRYEVIDAQVTSPLSELTISLRRSNGKWDVIYQDGVWGVDYASSTINNNGTDDNTFHITRAGGWIPNEPLQFRFKEGATGASTTGLFEGISFATGELSITTITSGEAGSINGTPVSWTILARFLTTGAPLGSADFFGNRNPPSGGGAFLGSYLRMDGAGGVTMSATRSLGEDNSIAWPAVADGKLHLITGTLNGSAIGSVLKLYVDGVDVGGSNTLANGYAGAAQRVGFGLSQSFPANFPNIVFCGGAYTIGAVSLAEHQAWAADIKTRGTFCGRSGDGSTVIWLPPQTATAGCSGYWNAGAGSMRGMANTSGASRVHYTFDVGDLAF